jgi:hypothetical protein
MRRRIGLVVRAQVRLRALAVPRRIRRPRSTSTYTIRVTVLADPQGATFAASKFMATDKDLGQADA